MGAVGRRSRVAGAVRTPRTRRRRTKKSARTVLFSSEIERELLLTSARPALTSYSLPSPASSALSPFELFSSKPQSHLLFVQTSRGIGRTPQGHMLFRRSLSSSIPRRTLNSASTRNSILYSSSTLNHLAFNSAHLLTPSFSALQPLRLSSRPYASMSSTTAPASAVESKVIDGNAQAA